MQESPTPRIEIPRLRSAIACFEEVRHQIEKREVALFLDYDGTLTPIVDRPEDACLSADMRDTLEKVGQYCPVAIISGRDLLDVQNQVGIEGLYYAGSHGFDISGPEAWHIEHRQGTEYLPSLDAAEKALRRQLDKVSGALIEHKKFSIAVHYRRVEDQAVPKVQETVDRVLRKYPDLRKTTGKKVLELQPDIDWNKGKALLWLLENLNLDPPDVWAIYVGDDTTDEDAFAALRHRPGIGIVVMEEPRPTAARYCLTDPQDVKAFLRAFLKKLAWIPMEGNAPNATLAKMVFTGPIATAWR